jgi:hypothetical protein
MMLLWPQCALISIDVTKQGYETQETFSTAVVDAVGGREHSDATLADWLDAHTPAPWVSSTLIEVELPRALRRIEPALLAHVPAILARVALRNRRGGPGRRGVSGAHRARVQALRQAVLDERGLGSTRRSDGPFHKDLSGGRFEVLVQQPDRESPPGIGGDELVAQLVKTSAVGVIQHRDVGGVHAA